MTAKKSTKAKPAKKRTKNPPKPSRKMVTKKPVEINGPAPLDLLDYEFCNVYVQTRSQVAAYRRVNPDHKDPDVAAHRMMQRPEIREHIKAIYREISKQRERAASQGARAALLSLDVADDRLMEIITTRRRTRGEMLTRDVKTLLVEGATPQFDDNGKITGYDMTDELVGSLLNEGAPIEDADLLKAVKLVYERRQGIIKPDKEKAKTPLHAMLYKPKWFGNVPQTIEGTV